MTDQPKQSKRETVEGLLKDVARTYPGQTGIVWNTVNISAILSIVEELEKENVNHVVNYERLYADASKQSAELASLKAQGEGECIWTWHENLGLWMTHLEDPWPRTFSKQERRICCPLCGKRIQST